MAVRLVQMEEMSVDVIVRRDEESASAFAATISVEAMVVNLILSMLCY